MLGIAPEDHVLRRDGIYVVVPKAGKMCWSSMPAYLSRVEGLRVGIFPRIHELAYSPRRTRSRCTPRTATVGGQDPAADEGADARRRQPEECCGLATVEPCVVVPWLRHRGL
jgi:hypothetical protein